MFWLTFLKKKEHKLPIGTRLGCGVTAFDENDAKSLIFDKVLGANTNVEFDEILSDISVDDLDKNHVIPNMGNPALRGIWFPLGYG